MRINESAAPKAMKEKTTIHNGWNKGSTQRVNRLRDQYWKWKPEVDTERAVVYTKTYQEMEAYDRMN